MNLTPTLRSPLPPRNHNPNLGNLGIIRNLGNTENSMNILGKLKNIKNSLGILSLNKNNPRGRAKRRSSLAKSLLPSAKGLRMILLCIRMGR